MLKPGLYFPLSVFFVFTFLTLHPNFHSFLPKTILGKKRLGMLGISSLIASLTLTSLGFPTPCTSTHMRLYTQWWAGPSLVEFPVKWVTHLRCDWFSMILMEHTDSKNKISLDPRLYSSSRGEGTPVPGQGVMKRKWGALLGLLCIQICCELGSSQRGVLGSVHSWQ